MPGARSRIRRPRARACLRRSARPALRVRAPRWRRAPSRAPRAARARLRICRRSSMPPISSSDLRAAAKSVPPHCAAARESSSSTRLLSSVCLLASSSARFSRDLLRLGGPGGKLQLRDVDLLLARELGQQQRDARRWRRPAPRRCAQPRRRLRERCSRSTCARSSSTCGSMPGSISSSSRTVLDGGSSARPP